MKIVITGGSGFIGTHISSLLRGTHELKIFDSQRPSLEGIDFVSGDITNHEHVAAVVKDCDAVIHLAAVVGVEKSESDPVKTLDVDIGGTRNVLEACRKNGVKKIIFASSSEVYGEPLKVPIEEVHTPIPITVYGVSKLAAEEYVKSYAKAHGIRYSILRFFSVYGPRQAPDFVIPRFVDCALQNKPITIHGDGSQTRAFCHVQDISNAVALALGKVDNEILNIGNDTEPVSITDLANKVVSLTGSKSQLVFVSFEESDRKRDKDILHRIPSIEKARKILGYEPQVSLDDGIMSVVGHARSAK